MISRIFLLLFLLVFVGCSTQPLRNSRSGLIDRWNKEGDGKTSNRMTSSGASTELEDYGESYELSPHIKKATANWTWPVSPLKVTSSFGPRGRQFHEGVDLRAAVGEPVFAVQEGTVLYSGRKIRGYGNMIIIKHTEGISSVYAHNSRILVRKGSKVKRGQKIATAGKSGRVRGPHLHFEVRIGLNPVDPTLLLPEVWDRNRRLASSE